MPVRRNRVIVDSDDDTDDAVSAPQRPTDVARPRSVSKGLERASTAAVEVVDLVGDDSDADMYETSVPAAAVPRRAAKAGKAAPRVAATFGGLTGLLTSTGPPSSRALTSSSRGNKPVDSLLRSGFIPPVSRPAPLGMRIPSAPASSSSAAPLAGSKRASSTPVLVMPAPVGPWTEAYAPTEVDQLALHVKKVQEMAAWLQRAKRGDAAARLLVVMGPPGIGKSTAVDLLARDAGMHVHRWIDDGTRRTHSGGGSAGDGDDDSPAEAGGWSDRRVRAAAAVRDFSAFVLQASLFPALEMNGPALPRSSAPVTVSRGSHVIVIEDLPRSLYGEHDAILQQMVQDIFRRVVHTSAFPVVLVLSEGEAVGDAPTKPALNRMLGLEVMQHAGVTVMNVPPTPPTRMRKAVQRVVDMHARATQTPALSTAVCESIIASAKEDVRHAIMTCEYAVRNPSLVIAAGRSSGATVCGRDDFLDSLHVLGKLLYAKRVKEDGAAGEGDGREGDGDACAAARRVGDLAYDPEALLSMAAYDATTTAAFMFENSPAFFSDVSEYSRATHAFSTADILLNQRVRAQAHVSDAYAGNASFPEQNAAAIVARSVSTYNLNPMPATFRALRKPVLYAVNKCQAANSNLLKHELLGVHGGGSLGLEAANAHVRTPAYGVLPQPYLSVAVRVKELLPTVAQLARAVIATQCGSADEYLHRACAQLRMDPRAVLLSIAAGQYGYTTACGCACACVGACACHCGAPNVRTRSLLGEVGTTALARRALAHVRSQLRVAGAARVATPVAINDAPAASAELSAAAVRGDDDDEEEPSAMESVMRIDNGRKPASGSRGPLGAWDVLADALMPPAATTLPAQLSRARPTAANARSGGAVAPVDDDIDDF